MPNSDTLEDRKPPSRIWLAVGGGAFAFGLVAFMAAGASGGAQDSDPPAEARNIAPAVEVETVISAPQSYSVRATGRLQPLQSLQVVGEVPGKIAYLNPQLVVGGRLEAGDVLFRIDQGDYLADLNRAEAQLATGLAALERARADRDRQVELATLGAVPDAASEAAIAGFANAEATVTQARAQLTVAQRNLTKTTVRAPFDAIVTQETLSADSYVAPGAPLAELIDASAGEIRAGLAPKDIAAVRRARDAANGVGVPVRAVPSEASLGVGTLVGHLDSFAPAIDPASRTVAVRAVFPDAFARERDGETFAGDFMTLEIEGRVDQPAYEVPTAALRRNASIWLVAENGTLSPATVTPLESRGATTLVTSSVNLANKAVLVTPLAEEVDGMRVRPVSLASDQAQ